MTQPRYRRAAEVTLVSYPAVAVIQGRVADYYHVSLDVLRSRIRSQHVAFVRHVAIWETRELTHLSYPVIGDCFARDHSSVIHGYNVIDLRAQNEAEFRHQLRRLQMELAVALGLQDPSTH